MEGVKTLKVLKGCTFLRLVGRIMVSLSWSNNGVPTSSSDVLWVMIARRDISPMGKTTPT